MSLVHTAVALLPTRLRNALRRVRPQNRLWDTILPLAPDLLCVDIGASYYPHPQWAPLRRSAGTRWLAVEPNEQNLGYASEWAHAAELRLCRTGLSEHGGPQTLYVTNVDSGSSLLPPVIHASQKHRVTNSDYFFPVTERTIDTKTLVEAIPPDWAGLPTMIKLDTQGTELSILRGARALLEQQMPIGIELESTLLAHPIMQGSGRFWEAQAFLEGLGYELLRLKPYEAPAPHGQARGHRYLNECDSVFGLTRDVLAGKPLAYRRAMFLFYAAYELYDEALQLLESDGELSSYGQSLGVEASALRKALFPST